MTTNHQTVTYCIPAGKDPCNGEPIFRLNADEAIRRVQSSTLLGLKSKRIYTDSLKFLDRMLGLQMYEALMKEVNELVAEHSWTRNRFATCLFVASTGILFCPMLYIACGTAGRINRDLQRSPNAKVWAARGLSFKYVSGGKFGPTVLYIYKR
jgi:hypothetical protein